MLGVELGFLRQVADVQTRHGGGFALNLGIQTGHDLQQGGLAGTVDAQDADLGTGEKAQGNVFENLTFGRHNLADLVHGENVLGHCYANLGGCKYPIIDCSTPERELVAHN